MIGFDLQEVERVKGVEDALIKRIALPSEVEYIQKFKVDKTLRIAALWSVKEATFKALDMIGNVTYKEIELCHKPSGRPYIVLHGAMKQHFDELGLKNIDVSISHQRGIVGAVVVTQ